jgi:hypothetical protein
MSLLESKLEPKAESKSSVNGKSNGTEAPQVGSEEKKPGLAAQAQAKG